MTRESNSRAAEVLRLSAALDERRDELESIPGVVGSGVGLASEGATEHVVVQVFVGSPSLVNELRQKVAETIGEGMPIETVFLPTPTAGLGEHGGDA